MKSTRRAPILLLLLALGATLFISSCDSVLDDASTVTLGSLEVQTTVSLPGYTVEALAPVVNANKGTTTYSYVVTVSNPGPPRFDWFFLEHACAATPGLNPSTAVSLAEVGGVTGYRWQASLPSGSRIYSYTYPTDPALPMGALRLTISRGGAVAPFVELPGPCGAQEVEPITISGSVFVDTDFGTDLNGVRDDDEQGIKDVLVEIRSASDVLVASGLTSATGTFSFEVPSISGSYKIVIPLSGDENSFNSILESSYNFTGHLAGVGLPYVVDGDADVGGINFGYTIDGDQILLDLSPDGAFTTSAKGVNFWRQVAHHATINQCYGGICPNELELLLEQIFFQPGDEEGNYLLLKDPYELNASNIFQDAKDILWPQWANNEVGVVYRNLFAVQLNYLHGLGTGNVNYDLTLLSYLEQWLHYHPDYEDFKDLLGLSQRPGGAGLSLEAVQETGSSEANRVFGGGGGGTTEEKITISYLGGGGGGTTE